MTSSVDGKTMLIRGGTLLTMDPKRGTDPVRADVLVRDGVIAEIDEDLSPTAGTTVVDAADRLIIPGLIDAHTHSYPVFKRGRREIERAPFELLWIRGVREGTVPLPTELIRLRALLVGLEALKAGVTCVLDDPVEGGSGSVERLGAVFDGYFESGIRAHCAVRMCDLDYIDTIPYAEVFPPELREELRGPRETSIESHLAFAREALATHHRRDDGRIRLAITTSAPYRCTPDLLTAAHGFAAENDLVFTIHAAQSKSEVVTGLDFYGMSLIEHMHQRGALSERTIVGHAMWLTERDISLFAETGASIAHNIVANLYCGMGILPFRDLLDAGVNVALGTDGIACCGSARMFDVMRTAALIHKVSTPDYSRWPTSEEIVRATTTAPARALGAAQEIGSIEVGKAADLVLLDTRTTNFFPLHNPATHLVYSENGSSVDKVMVAGEILVDGGRHTKIDESALLAELAERLPSIEEKWDEAEELVVGRFEPYVTEIYRRCIARDVGLNRFAGDEAEWLETISA
jgi:cytosine/adenosine deaminase-related metal-dependent hydrolase